MKIPAVNHQHWCKLYQVFTAASFSSRFAPCSMALDTTNQLALHQARQAQLNKSTRYIESFISSLNSDQDYDLATCPTCGYLATEVLFLKRQGRYCHCPHCDHVYLSNPLRPNKLLEFYAGYPTSSLEWHQNESEFYQRIYTKGLSMLQPHCIGDRILDVGCSSGYFLSIAAKQGLESFGIEPNRQEAAYASEQGIRILGATVADLNENTCFDAISLWDVLEHVREPVAFIQRLRAHLHCNGCVFVQVPSSDSLAARIMREACNMFDGFEHLTLFSLRSLDIAFRSAGFVPLEKDTVISEVHALQNYLNYEKNPYLSNPKNTFAAAFLEADQIESKGLGYKIQAVYRLHS